MIKGNSFLHQVVFVSSTKPISSNIFLQSAFQKGKLYSFWTPRYYPRPKFYRQRVKTVMLISQSYRNLPHI